MEASAQLVADFRAQVERVEALARYLSAQPHNYINISSFVGKVALRAEVAGLVELLISKGVITGDEYLAQAVEALKQYLAEEEKKWSIAVGPAFVTGGSNGKES